MSEFRKIVDETRFKQAFQEFIVQAEKNYESGKANGSRTPYGFPKKPACDGAEFKQQFGQGAASATPYMNWWCVSIYYLPNIQNIILGIEKDRYPHLTQMKLKPLHYLTIGNKKVDVAVYFSSAKANINYKKLYNAFMDVCEEVMSLGLY